MAKPTGVLFDFLGVGFFMTIGAVFVTDFGGPYFGKLPMTRLIDFDTLREADVPCFGSLERAIVFLRDNMGTTGRVYPPP